jgi:hypothetical protein
MYTGGWSEGRVYNGIVRKDERLDHTVSTFTRNWWHLRLSQLSAIVCVTFNAGVIVTESAIALAQLCGDYLRCGMANALKAIEFYYAPFCSVIAATIKRKIFPYGPTFSQ